MAYGCLMEPTQVNTSFLDSPGSTATSYSKELAGPSATITMNSLSVPPLSPVSIKKMDRIEEHQPATEESIETAAAPASPVKRMQKFNSTSNVLSPPNLSMTLAKQHASYRGNLNAAPLSPAKAPLHHHQQAARRPSTTFKRKGVRKKVRNPEKNQHDSYSIDESLHDSGVINADGPEAAINTVALMDANPHKLHDREYVSIHDDVYNLFFLSRVGGHAFWYSLYVFGLKMALYTFLAMDAFQNDYLDEKTDFKVLCAQFLMLPVAVAMQDDLIATYYLIANIKYCDSIRHQNPDAYEWKFHVGTACRAIDGAYSLTVNFVILVSATDVLTLFLNFAALQFLQTIDNIALELAADGYLTDRLEDVAGNVKAAELPKRGDDNWLRCLDTVLFVCTCAVLLAFWLMFILYVQTE